MFNIYALNASVQLPHFGSYEICVELRFGFGTLGTALCYLTSFFNGCILALLPSYSSLANVPFSQELGPISEDNPPLPWTPTNH
ncbi:hypothetical protein K438DRAFT_1840553 [Mycena galopus ATCC 62051]|nr:hypothetical protein K438DRAFT_1840553 [Mycena galopus ATCC 62051]